MAQQASGEPKQVPKRNDLKSSGLYRNTKAMELRGYDPNFHYEIFTDDPDSPGHIERKLRDHEVGDPARFLTMVGPWQVCNALTDPRVTVAEQRTDQGTRIDSTTKHGRKYLCRLPKEEYAKYQEVERANLKEREKELFEPDRLRGDQASTTAVVMDGDRDEIARIQALVDAGHPIPGMARQST